MAYPITRWWFIPLISLFCRDVMGIKNIPNPPFIIIANHSKLIDPLLIYYALLLRINKKIHFLSSARWYKFLGKTICCKWAGCVLLLNPKSAYKQMKRLLQKKEIVAIFPQGYLNLSDRKPKNGVIRLALETRTKILPIKLSSSYIPFNSNVVIGNPIILKKFIDCSTLINKINRM